MTPAKVVELLKNAGANTTGAWIQMPPWRASGRGFVQATIDGAGAIGSNVTIQGSHDGVHAFNIGAVLALTAADTDTDGLAIDYPWPLMRAVSAGAAGAMTNLRVTVAL